MGTTFRLGELAGVASGSYRLDTAEGSDSPADDLSLTEPVLLVRQGQQPAPVKSSSGRTVLYAKRLGLSAADPVTLVADAPVQEASPLATQAAVDAAAAAAAPSGGTSLASPSVDDAGKFVAVKEDATGFDFVPAPAPVLLAAAVQASPVMEEFLNGDDATLFLLAGALPNAGWSLSEDSKMLHPPTAGLYAATITMTSANNDVAVQAWLRQTVGVTEYQSSGKVLLPPAGSTPYPVTGTTVIVVNDPATEGIRVNLNYPGSDPTVADAYVEVLAWRIGDVS